jgi:hypothetical protein
MKTQCDKCENWFEDGLLNADGEDIICDNCAQNAAEAAYERHCEDFHDGGSTKFNSLLDQQIEARKLK